MLRLRALCRTFRGRTRDGRAEHGEKMHAEVGARSVEHELAAGRLIGFVKNIFHGFFDVIEGKGIPRT